MDQIEQLMKALADQNRLKIIAALSQKKLCVCELAELLGITQPSVSKHLKKLKEAQLIESEQDGFWTNYYLTKSFFQNNKFIKAFLDQLLLEKEIKKLVREIKSLDRESICCSK